MKYIIIILSFIISISLKAQIRFPTGFPTQSNTGWNKWGYGMTDSGLIVANRDTTWKAKFSGTIVFRPANKKFYWFDSTLLNWNLLAGHLDTAYNGLSVENNAVILGGTLNRFTDINNNGNDIFIHGTGQNTLRTQNGTFQANISTSSLSATLTTINSNNNLFSEVNAIEGSAYLVGGRNGRFYNSVHADSNSVFLSTKDNVSPKRAILDTLGYFTLDAYSSLTQETDSTTNKPVAMNSSGKLVRMRSWIAGSGPGSGLTSVGLSMPSAFTIPNSPLTVNGTLNVTMPGLSTQYLKGNGTLGTTDTGMIPNFYLKVRGLLSGTSPITFNQTTGIIGVLRANTTGQLGVATFNNSDFMDNGAGLISLRSGGGSGTVTQVNSGFGITGGPITITGTLTADTSTNALSTRWADHNITQYDLNSNNFILQQRIDTLEFGGDVSAIHLDSNRIFCVYGRVPIGNDFNNFQLWTVTIDSLNGLSNRRRLFVDSFITENSEINPSLFRLPNGNLGLIFSGYNAANDVQLYFTSSSDKGLTWSAKVQILTDGDVGHLFLSYPDRVIRGIDGTYYLPFAVNTDDNPSTGTGTWQGRYMKSTNGTTWVLQSTLFNSPDNGCIEPGIFETDVDIQDPNPVSVKKLVYYWRSKSNTTFCKDSAYDGSSWNSAVRALGINNPNSPVTIKSHGKILFASYNALLTNAATGIQSRNKLIYAISSDNGNSFSIAARLFQYVNDTITPFEPTLFYDTTNNSVLVFYSTIETINNFGDILAARMNNVYTNIAGNVPQPLYSNMDIIGGDNLPHIGANLYWFNLYDQTVTFTNGHFSIGNGISDHSAFAPNITTLASSTYNGGSIWDAHIGSDTYAGPYSAAVTINGIGHASGSLSNADILSVLNNSTVEFRVKSNGTLVAPNLDSAVAPVNTLTVDASGNIKKSARGTGSQWTTNGSSDIYFPASGLHFVGIGTSTPASPLDINVTTVGTSGYTARFVDGNSSLGSTLVFGWTGAGSGNKIKAFFVDGNGLGIGTLPDAITGAPTAQLTLRNGGNFGVGITSPSWKLHVNGSVGFELGSDATLDMFYRGSGGNLNRLAVGTALQQLRVNSGATGYEWFTPSSSTTIYSGDGAIAGNRTVIGNNLSLTFDTIFNFRVNANTFILDQKAKGFPYTAAVISTNPHNYQLGYTPTATVYSKGAGVYIDTNNNVGLGASIATAVPLYSIGQSAYINGLQSGLGNFYKVSSISTNTTATLQDNFFVIDATSGNVTVTLPAASAAFGSNMGIDYTFQRVDNSGNSITIQRAGSDTINGATSFTLTTQYDVKNIRATSTTTWAIH